MRKIDIIVLTIVTVLSFNILSTTTLFSQDLLTKFPEQERVVHTIDSLKNIKTLVFEENDNTIEEEIAEEVERIITHVDLTCYQPLYAQCDGDPLITADMSKINLNDLKKGKIKWCAISRDLLWLIPMGSTIHIEGHGEYEVHDVMNKRWTHKIDILIHPSDNSRFHKKNIKVVKIA